MNASLVCYDWLADTCWAFLRLAQDYVETLENFLYVAGTKEVTPQRSIETALSATATLLYARPTVDHARGGGRGSVRVTAMDLLEARQAHERLATLRRTAIAYIIVRPAALFRSTPLTGKE